MVDARHSLIVRLGQDLGRGLLEVGGRGVLGVGGIELRPQIRRLVVLEVFGGIFLLRVRGIAF